MEQVPQTPQNTQTPQSTQSQGQQGSNPRTTRYTDGVAQYTFNGKNYNTKEEAVAARDTYKAAVNADWVSVGKDRAKYDALIESGRGLSQMSDDELGFIRDRYAKSDLSKRKEYTKSGTDAYLFSMGLPSAKEINSYRQKYIDYIGEGGMEQYPELLEKRGDEYWTTEATEWIKKQWAEDNAVGLNDETVTSKGNDIKYEDTLLDEQLFELGLPPSAKLNEYFLKYKKDLEINDEIEAFNNEVFDLVHGKDQVPVEEAFYSTLKNHDKLVPYLSEEISFPSEDDQKYKDDLMQFQRDKYNTDLVKALEADAKRDQMSHRISVADYKKFDYDKNTERARQRDLDIYNKSKEKYDQWFTKGATTEKDKEQRRKDVSDFLNFNGYVENTYNGGNVKSLTAEDINQIVQIEPSFRLLDNGVPSDLVQKLYAGNGSYNAATLEEIRNWNDKENLHNPRKHAEIEASMLYTGLEGSYDETVDAMTTTWRVQNSKGFDRRSKYNVDVYTSQIGERGVTEGGALYALVAGQQVDNRAVDRTSVNVVNESDNRAHVGETDEDSGIAYSFYSSVDSSGTRMIDYLTDDEKAVYFCLSSTNIKNGSKYLNDLQGVVSKRSYMNTIGGGYGKILSGKATIEEFGDYTYNTKLYEKGEELRGLKEGRTDYWKREAWDEYSAMSDAALERRRNEIVAESSSAQADIDAIRDKGRMYYGGVEIEDAYKHELEKIDYVLSTRKQLKQESTVEANLKDYTDAKGNMATERVKASADYGESQYAELINRTEAEMRQATLDVAGMTDVVEANRQLALGGKRDANVLRSLSTEQKNKFNYLLVNSGAKVADAYIDLIYNSVDAEAAKEKNQGIAGWAGKNIFTKAGATALSVLVPPATSGVISLLGTLGNALTGKETSALQATMWDFSNEWREAVPTGDLFRLFGMSDENAQKWGQIGYGAVMSMVDSTGAAFLNLLGGDLGTIALASSAFSSSLRNGLMRGLDPDVATGTAFVSGVAEYLTEKVGLETIMDTVKAFKSGTFGAGKVLQNALLRAIKPTVTEASEEAMSTIINTIADSMLNGDLSEYNVEYNGYIDAGYTPEEARKLANKSWAEGLITDAAIGGVTGFLMSFGGMVGGVRSDVTYNRMVEAGIDPTTGKRSYDTPNNPNGNFGATKPAAKPVLSERAQAYTNGRTAVERVFNKKVADSVQNALDNNYIEDDKVSSFDGQLQRADNTDFIYYSVGADNEGKLRLTDDERTSLAVALAATGEDDLDVAYTMLKNEEQTPKQRLANADPTFKRIKSVEEVKNLNRQIAENKKTIQDVLDVLNKRFNNTSNELRNAYAQSMADLQQASAMLENGDIKGATTALNALESKYGNEVENKTGRLAVFGSDFNQAVTRIEQNKAQIETAQALLDRHYATLANALNYFSLSYGSQRATAMQANRVNQIRKEIGAKKDAILLDSSLDENAKQKAYDELEKQEQDLAGLSGYLSRYANLRSGRSKFDIMQKVKNGTFQDFVAQSNKEQEQAATPVPAEKPAQEVKAEQPPQNAVTEASPANTETTSEQPANTAETGSEAVKQENTTQEQAEEKEPPQMREVKVNKNWQKRITAVAKRFGLKVVFGELVEDGQPINGKYDPEHPDTVYLNTTLRTDSNRSNEQVIALELLRHEAVHWSKETKAYESLKEMAILYLQEQGADVQGVIDGILRDNPSYKGSQELGEEEMTAMFVQTVLFGGDDGSRRAMKWMAQSSRRNVFNSMKKYNDYLIARSEIRNARDGDAIKLLLLDAEMEFTRAIEERQTLDGKKPSQAEAPAQPDKDTKKSRGKKKQAKENTAQETPAQEAQAQETPVQETPKQETPAQETPAQEAQTQETPAREATTQETPAQEAPVQEAQAQAETAEPAQAQSEQAQSQQETTATEQQPAQEAQAQEQAPAQPQAEAQAQTDTQAQAQTEAQAQTDTQAQTEAPASVQSEQTASQPLEFSNEHKTRISRIANSLNSGKRCAIYLNGVQDFNAVAEQVKNELLKYLPSNRRRGLRVATEVNPNSYDNLYILDKSTERANRADFTRDRIETVTLNFGAPTQSSSVTEQVRARQEEQRQQREAERRANQEQAEREREQTREQQISDMAEMQRSMQQRQAEAQAQEQEPAEQPAQEPSSRQEETTPVQEETTPVQEEAQEQPAEQTEQPAPAQEERSARGTGFSNVNEYKAATLEEAQERYAVNTPPRSIGATHTIIDSIQNDRTSTSGRRFSTPVDMSEFSGSFIAQISRENYGRERNTTDSRRFLYDALGRPNAYFGHAQTDNYLGMRINRYVFGKNTGLSLSSARADGLDATQVNAVRDGREINEHFVDHIINYGFVPENILKGSSDITSESVFNNGEKNNIGEDIVFSDEQNAQLKDVCNKLVSGKEVILALPVTKDFEAQSLQALRSIFNALPVAFRTKVSFASGFYLDDLDVSHGQHVAVDRAKLIITDQTSASNLTGLMAIRTVINLTDGVQQSGDTRYSRTGKSLSAYASENQLGAKANQLDTFADMQRIASHKKSESRSKAANNNSEAKGKTLTSNQQTEVDILDRELDDYSDADLDANIDYYSQPENYRNNKHIYDELVKERGRRKFIKSIIGSDTYPINKYIRNHVNGNLVSSSNLVSDDKKELARKVFSAGQIETLIRSAYDIEREYLSERAKRLNDVYSWYLGLKGTKDLDFTLPASTPKMDSRLQHMLTTEAQKYGSFYNSLLGSKAPSPATWASRFGAKGIEEIIQSDYELNDAAKRTYRHVVDFAKKNGIDGKYVPSFSDVLSVYVEDHGGKNFVGHKTKQAELPLSESLGRKDARIYAPKQRLATRETWELANRDATNVDSQGLEEIMQARKDVVFASYYMDYSKEFGITKYEYTKAIEDWSKDFHEDVDGGQYFATGYNVLLDATPPESELGTAELAENSPLSTFHDKFYKPAKMTALEKSRAVNEGVAEENRFSGFENVTVLSKANVRDSDIGHLVKEVKGNTIDNEAEQYQRNYIANTMLALDTHIDWSGLSITFHDALFGADQSRGVKEIYGRYKPTEHSIDVGNKDSQDTVSHEMGHALDRLWKDFLYGEDPRLFPTSEKDYMLSQLSYDELKYRLNSRKDLSEEQKNRYLKFHKNFTDFVDKLVLSTELDTRNEYLRSRHEVFARFVADFVTYVNKLVGINEVYTGEFNENAYTSFIKILQGMSALQTQDNAYEAFETPLGSEYDEMDMYQFEGEEFTDEDFEMPTEEDYLSELEEQYGTRNTPMYSNGHSLDYYIQQYGMKQQSPYARANNIRTPNQTAKNNRVSDAVQTLKQVPYVPQNLRDRIDEGILNEGLGVYEPKALDELREQGMRYITEHGGVTQAMRDLTATMRDVKAKDLVKTISAANQVFATLSQEGINDSQEYADFVAEYVMMRSTWGRAGRAMQLVNDSPLGRRTYWERVVQRINEQNRDAIARGLNPLFHLGGYQDIDIPQKLYDDLQNAQTREQIEEAEEAITRYIGENSPLTVSDAMRNWRYFAMLANPVTHMRNMLGNVTMQGGRLVKDAIATGLENIAVRAGWMNDNQRTHSIILRQDSASRNAIESLYQEHKGAISSGGRDGFRQTLNEAKRKSPSKFINRLMNFNSNMLENEDELFLHMTFMNAAAQFASARGIDVTKMSKQQRADLVAYATQQAQEATYRDASKLADALNEFARSGWVQQLLVEGIMPFKKTPINITKRGISYSPFGLAKGIVDLARNAVSRSRGGELVVSANKVVDELAQGLTGSMLSALGFFLARCGILKLKAGQDDRDDVYERDVGHQNYSLEVGNLSIKIESLAPLTFPLFMGASLYELTSRENGGFSVSDITDAALSVADPLMDMSFMSSLNEALDTYSENGVMGVAGNVMWSYASQYLPTLGSKVNNFINESFTERRTAKSDAASPLGGTWDYRLRSAASKVPVANQAWLQPYVTTSGNYQRNDSFGEYVTSFLNNFVSPVNVQVVDTTPVNDEIHRLVRETGNTDFVPQNPTKYFNVGNERKNLNATEYTQYSKDHNETVYAVLTQIINQPAYQNLTDEQRVDVLTKAYNSAHRSIQQKYQGIYAQKQK